METSLQAGKIINARHLTFHVGPYGEYEPGTEANEQVANVMAGVVERVREVWGDEEEEEEVEPQVTKEKKQKQGKKENNVPQSKSSSDSIKPEDWEKVKKILMD